MQFDQLEKMFLRAWKHTFTRKKFFIVFPILVLCGILIVFCRAMALNASKWIAMSMIFLPIFLVSGVLLALGVLLNKIYFDEIKGLKIEYKKILGSYWEVIIGTSYLAIPSILVYLLMWMVLGLFILFRQIPAIGDFFGVIFTFLPFLLILGSIALIVLNVSLLFFVTPHIVFSLKGKWQWIQTIMGHLRQHFLRDGLLFFLGVFPLIIGITILTLAAVITDLGYLQATNASAVVLEWFFIMIPFAFFLTPCVLFFFNFACESYHMRKHGS